MGHQAYAHKIITSRRDAFVNNRKLNGISGFPRMAESEYDSFGAGHASVSISAALGMVKAGQLRGENFKSVAVIGDGAMTGGLAFEGINNAGADRNNDILVILNDNNMAIDNATGALNGYLVRMSTSKTYNWIKQRLWAVLSHIPPVLRFCQKSGNAIKHGLMPLESGGRVLIKSYETETHFCVEVSDNGVGFDTSVAIDKKEHVGMNNIRERLKAIVNGELIIESTVGVGTKATIMIPKEGRA